VLARFNWLIICPILKLKEQSGRKYSMFLNRVLNSFLYMLTLFSVPALPYGFLIIITDQVLKKYK
jgi:hypothetical protein